MTREEQIVNEANKQEELVNIDAASFIEGAKWADKNPVLPWISVEDDLPYKHKELVYHIDGGKIELTYVVIVKDENGNVDLSSMCCQDDNWRWVLDVEFKYWLPVSALEAFTRK